MPRMMHYDRMQRLFSKALNAGARRVGSNTLDWSIAGNCENPFTTEAYSRPSSHIESGNPMSPDKYYVYKPGLRPSLRVWIHTRCRKCKSCAQVRSNLWRYRAREETRRAARTWFGTLTMSAETHFRMESFARHSAHMRHVDWHTLPYEERFRRIANTSLKEVTKYIKRVRKQSGVPLRYICVTEKHRSGLPHFHMLVHEVELKPVTHKILSSQWTSLGFERWRLVDFATDPRRSANYVCKYLSKDAQTRIRNSIRYGQSIGLSGDVLTAIRNSE